MLKERSCLYNEMYSMVKTGSMKLFEMCSMVPAGEYSGTLQGP